MNDVNYLDYWTGTQCAGIGPKKTEVLGRIFTFYINSLMWLCWEGYSESVLRDEIPCLAI